MLCVICTHRTSLTPRPASTIPSIQPKDALMPNNQDLQWALLISRVEATRRGLHTALAGSDLMNSIYTLARSQTDKVDKKLLEKQEAYNAQVQQEVEALHKAPLMDILLMRSTAVATAPLVSRQELFGPHIEVADTDIVRLRQLWEEFLTPVSNASVSANTAGYQGRGNVGGAASTAVYKDLPVDHVRIDLLYAEDTRRSNAKLHGPHSDTHTYLLALQLALSWVEEEDIGPHSASR